MSIDCAFLNIFDFKWYIFFVVAFVFFSVVALITINFIRKLKRDHFKREVRIYSYALARNKNDIVNEYCILWAIEVIIGTSLLSLLCISIVIHFSKIVLPLIKIHTIYSPTRRSTNTTITQKFAYIAWHTKNNNNNNHIVFFFFFSSCLRWYSKSNRETTLRWMV